MFNPDTIKTAARELPHASLWLDKETQFPVQAFLEDLKAYPTLHQALQGVPRAEYGLPSPISEDPTLERALTALNFHNHPLIHELLPSLVTHIWENNPSLHQTDLRYPQYDYFRDTYSMEAWHLLAGCMSRFHPDDIAYFLTQPQTREDQILHAEQKAVIECRIYSHTRKMIPLQWLPSPNTLAWMNKALDSLTIEMPAEL